MRNRLIHGYFAVDLDLVWKTTMDEIRRLEALLRSVVDSLDEVG